MRYRTIDSVLPMLKLSTGNTNIDQYLPELAGMVPMVERNLGLSTKALHHRHALNIEVSKSKAVLPTDFFEEDELFDCYYMCHPRNILGECICNCDPCHCGYRFLNDRCGTFSFRDCTVDCPFPTGTVSFSYWGLEMDTDGLPMILEGHVEAFIAYVSQILKKGEMNSGLVSPQIYRLNKEDWNEQSLITRSRDNVPSKRSVRIADQVTGTPLKFFLKG